MDADKARFAVELMERYDALHWDILTLRQNAGRDFAVGDDVDRARFRVSRFFANLQMLIDGGFIDQGFAGKVIPKVAHALCAKLVGPLDAKVRERRGTVPKDEAA